jgi:O-antigen/teichoic acid export membrane protein
MVYGLAIILSRGMLMIALLVVALFLPPADYGALVMIATTGFLVNVTVALEVSQGLARYYAGASEADKKIYASTAWWFTVLMFVLFIAASEFAAGYLCQLILGDDRYLNALRYALVAMSLNGIFYFVQCQFRWEFKSWDYAVVSLIHAVSSLGGSIGLGMIVDPAIDGVVLGQLLGASVAVLVGGWRLRASITRVFDISKLKEMLQFSLPLVPASMSLFVGLYASRIILNSVASLEEVGLFGFASQIAGMTILVIVGIQAALTPLIMARHSEPETPAKLARLFEGFTALAICVCLGLGLFAQELIYLIAIPAYAAAAPIVLVLASATIISQMYIFAPGLSIAKKTIWQLWISVASAGVGVLANFWLIGLWGIYGAAFATLLAAVSFLVMWFVASQRLYPVPVRWGLVAVAMLGATVVGVFNSFIVEQNLLISIVLKLAMILPIVVFLFLIKLVSIADFSRVLTILRTTVSRK